MSGKLSRALPEAGQTGRKPEEDKVAVQMPLLPSKLPQSEPNRVAFCPPQGLIPTRFECSLLASRRLTEHNQNARRFTHSPLSSEIPAGCSIKVGENRCAQPATD